MTPLGAAGQLGIVVPDIAEATRRYGRMFGITTWQRYTYSADHIPHLEYRGHPAEFTVHIALGGSDPQIELLEADANRSVYRGHIGMHHVGVFVDSLDDAIRTMTEQGYSLLQAGRGYGADGDGGFAYFDTTDELHVMVEAIEVPRRRKPSLADWDRSILREGRA